MLLDFNMWPKQVVVDSEAGKEKVIFCIGPTTEQSKPVIAPERYSQYTRMIRITAWVLRFIHVPEKDN